MHFYQLRETFLVDSFRQVCWKNHFYIQIMDIEIKLEVVGNQGRFQVYTNIISALIWTMVSINTFLPSYLFITPTFTCSGTQNIKEIDACPKISTCSLEQTSTVTYSANLYCDQLYVRNSILSAQFAGCIAGLIIFPILSDKFGRKGIIILALIIDLLGSTLLAVGSKLAILPLIYIGTVLIGLSYALPLLIMTYVAQVCSQNWKARSPIIGYSFWTVGEILLYPIIVYIKDLVHLFCFIYILPLVVIIFLAIFITESPEFLYCNKRYQECKASLDYIARFNNKPELNYFDEPLEEVVNQGSATANPQSTFFSCQYMVPLVLLSLAHFCSSGFYYTIQYSLDEYGYRFEFNMLLVGSFELFSCLVTNFIAPKLIRKPTIIVLLLVSAALGICDQFIKSQVADFIILGFIRCLLTSSFTVIWMIAVETFPLELRSRGLGIPEILAMVSNMIAPFFVIFATNQGIKTVLIGGIMNAVAGFAMFFIKETKIKPTDEQVELRNQKRIYNKFLQGLAKIFDQATSIVSITNNTNINIKQ